mgnify:CR=1 FL=1
MGVDYLQSKPKLILTYPHKSTFNRIGFSSMVSLSFIVLWILNHLMSYNTDFSGNSTGWRSAPCMVYGILSLHKWSEIRNLRK